jgi:hypothetical protein
VLPVHFSLGSPDISLAASSPTIKNTRTSVVQVSEVGVTGRYLMWGPWKSVGYSSLERATSIKLMSFFSNRVQSTHVCSLFMVFGFRSMQITILQISIIQCIVVHLMAASSEAR